MRKELKKLEIGGYKVALGLDWNTLESGRNWASSLTALQKNAGIKTGFSLGDKKSDMQVALLKSEKREKLISPAVALAKQFPFLLHVEKLDDWYWVLLVANGRILVTTDLCVPEIEIEDVIGELIETIEAIIDDEPNAQFQVHVPDEPIFEAFVDKSHATLESIIIDSDSIKGCQLHHISTQNTPLLVAGIVFLVGIGIHQAWPNVQNYLEERNTVPNFAKSEEQRMMEQEVELIKLRSKAKEEEKAWLGAKLDIENWGAVKAMISDFALDFPKAYKGWKLGRAILMVNSADETVEIASSWQRGKDGTINSIKGLENYLTNANVNVSHASVDQAEVFSTLKMKKSGDGIPVGQIETWLELRSQKIDDAISMFQINEERWEWSFDEVEPMPRFEPIYGLPDTENMAFQLEFTRYNWSAQGEGHIELSSLIDKLKSLVGFSVKSIEMTLTESDGKTLVWEAKGEYYAQ